MSKVIVVNIVSLDGYYTGPHDNVMALPMDPAFDLHNRESIEGADTVLLGATSFRMFGSYWPGIADAVGEPGDPRLSEDNRRLSRRYNQIDKVVVSDSLEVPGDHPWHATTSVIPRRGVRTWVEQRRGQQGRDIVVFGSHLMWNALLQQGLVDELHLMVGPVALGEGTPLFTAPVSGLRLLGTRHFAGSDNVLLTYAAS